ncbi:MAG: helix-turn-helix transcriptional regulator [Alphaproteobacteria bacterium]|nr:helix-turn-helix transcriptional regulator [Alphaproteobacteria bacterium]MBU1561718.1 helix-turn-helix transcriptional regulator [Alphaproteobacteria bacterium]MBU2303008.1 helix-turn-helix transcriptional regulator [Alphaproteobacteria bacterium]MBU2368794.1 helix-turn-helix transcriptional regulator [Alphaproteobacteria bacterium]
MKEPKSGCPINLGLEVFGDRWTLLILRDIMFAERRSFRDIQASEEAISAKTLADRIGRLIDEGILVRSADPAHSQRSILKLTQKGIDLLPLLVDISIWSLMYKDVDSQLADLAHAASQDREGFIRTETKRLMSRDL